MKVFVAGATGAIGKQLVPILVQQGHEVTGMTRSPAKADAVRALGAHPAVADAFDPEAVAEAVAAAEPEVVVHQLTAIDAGAFGRSIDKVFVETNRLRTEGTDHLLAAALAVGARRFIAQSFAAWPYKRVGGMVKTEEDPLDDDPPKSVRETVATIKYMEKAVTGAQGIEGLALRYGWFYGPGTSISLAPDGEQVEMIRKRRLPIVGSGEGVWSMIHIHDAAAATAAAIERGAPGAYNVVDDDPAPVSVLLPELAKVVGAKPPRHVPKWLGQLVAGDPAVIMMTSIRGSSNEKAKRELEWQPGYPSWRLGFRDGLEQADREPERMPA
ncbi:MAG TPA: NAD(P)-dependent oxidoreductase [Solirubrobacterales bacterium]